MSDDEYDEDDDEYDPHHCPAHDLFQPFPRFEHWNTAVDQGLHQALPVSTLVTLVKACLGSSAGEFKYLSNLLRTRAGLAQAADVWADDWVVNQLHPACARTFIPTVVIPLQAHHDCLCFQKTRIDQWDTWKVVAKHALCRRLKCRTQDVSVNRSRPGRYWEHNVTFYF